VSRAWLAPLVAAALLCPALVLRSSWPPDETRYADVARAMAEGGSLAVPTLNGEPYTEKPPLPFWAAAALAEAGVPVLAALRVVSLAAGVLTVALVPALGAGLGLPAAAAARGALVLATTPLFLVHAQLGMLDALLAAAVAAAAACKLRRGRAGARRTLWTGLEGAALGAALLTKGPVALLFALGLRLGAGRRPGPARADASDLAALGLALALALAWLLAAAAEGGADYALGLAFGQLARRVAGVGGDEVPHPAAPGELLAVGFAWLLPWSALGLAALRRETRRALPGGTAPLVGWLFAPWVALSLLPSQQVQYLLPALPAGALLAGALAGAPLARALERGLRALGAALGAGLLASGAALDALLAPDAFEPSIRAALAGDAVLRAGLAAAGAAILLACLLPLRGRALWPRAAAAAALCFAVALLVSWRADDWISGRPILSHAVVAGAARVAAPSAMRSAVRVYAGRPEVEALEKDELLAEARRDPGLVALVWQRHLGRFPPGAFEELARGHVMGRGLLAVRGQTPQSPGSPQPASAP
jgi:4-amino-4-deoxy-L-arabinose transferase-like glycosyltransferase